MPTLADYTKSLDPGTIKKMIVEESQRQGLTPDQTTAVLGIAAQETGFKNIDNGRKDPRDGVGVFQFTPGTARSFGMNVLPRTATGDVDPGDDRLNPYKNVQAGVQLFKRNLQAAGGDIWGTTGAVKRHNGLGQGGDPDYRAHVQQQLAKMEPNQSLLSRIGSMFTPREASAAENPSRELDVKTLAGELFPPKTSAAWQSPSFDAKTLAGELFPPASPVSAPMPDQMPFPQQVSVAGQPAPAQKTTTPDDLIAQAEASGGTPQEIADAKALIAHEAQQRQRADLPVAQPASAPPKIMQPLDPNADPMTYARTPIAMGINAAGTSLGATAGGIAGSVAGPVGAVAGGVAGEAAGSLAARKANVALGLEEPGVGGDVAAVALPLAGRAVAAGIPFALHLKDTMKSGKLTNAAAQEIEELGKKYDVPLSTGDVGRNPFVKWLETMIEKIPGGGSYPFRKEQMSKLRTAANEASDAAYNAMSKLSYEGLDTVKELAKKGNPEAYELLRTIEGSGDDWHRIIQASGDIKVFNAQLKANQLYDKVAMLAQEAGGAVATRQTGHMLEYLQQELSRQGVPDIKTMNFLDGMRQRLFETNHTVGQFMQMRSTLGNLIEKAYQGKNSLVGEQGVGVLTRLRHAVENDLIQYMKDRNNPALMKAWRDADNYYRDVVTPFKDHQIAMALTASNPDEVYARFIQAGKGDRAEKFYTALDEKGRAAVRYGMVNEAVENATRENIDTFSPAKFAQYLEKRDIPAGVFFKGDAKWELDGLTKLMRHTERAGQIMENPPTGNRLIPLLLGGTAYGLAGTAGPVGLGVGIGGARVMQKFLTNPRTRQLLINASDMQIGSKAMSEVQRQLGLEWGAFARGAMSELARDTKPEAGASPLQTGEEIQVGDALSTYR